MNTLTARFCVGCGQVLDELSLPDNPSSWITAAAYREKYGFRFTDLSLIGDACPPCARVFAIGRRESLPETAGHRCQDERVSIVRLAKNHS